MTEKERLRILDGIETLYPADSPTVRTAFIGQVLLHHALENTYYNWRDLPLDVLVRYLAICEDYEKNAADAGNRENPFDSLPGYLKQ